MPRWRPPARLIGPSAATPGCSMKRSFRPTRAAISTSCARTARDSDGRRAIRNRTASAQGKTNQREGKTMSKLRMLLGAVVAASAMMTAAQAQEAKHYRFAYDQPKTTGYGIVGDIFAEKLKALSKGTMLVDQYPGAQLGQEPQVLQLVRAGDVEFCISSSANAATLSPQAGVMSMHFLFRSEAHLIKAIADPEVSKAVKTMIAETVQGARVIALATLGLRNMYSKREIKNLGELKGLKVRVQATPTEDTMFPAYGAQIVHMPFGSVYTSLQTGVVDVAENGVNVYLANKHYEV